MHHCLKLYSLKRRSSIFSLAQFLQPFLRGFNQEYEKGLTSMSQSDSVLSPKLKASLSARGAGSIDVRHIRSRTRFEAIEQSSLGSRDEALVVDERAHLRPSQVVEGKLTRMLKDASLPVSHLQMRGLLRSR
jgi:hypothetical protein